MAFTNKDGLATGLSNSKAGQLGYPTSGEMNMSQGLTPPPQMQQTPYQHQGGQTGQQQPQDRGYMQPVQPFNEGMQTRGAQYDVTPSRVSPGVASFLRTDAVMKQSGAQRHDLVNRLDSLEKNQQSVIPGVDNMKLATLVQMAKARPQAQQGAIPQPVPGQQGIPSPQEQSMYAQAPDVGGAAAGEEIGSTMPQDVGGGLDRGAFGGTAEEAAAKGFAPGVDPSVSPDEQGVIDSQEILSGLMTQFEDGGVIDQGMMAVANQRIAAQERRLRSELAAQSGGASMTGHPAMVQQNFEASRNLIVAKSQAEQLKLQGKMQIAQLNNDIEMGRELLQLKEKMVMLQAMAQSDIEMDLDTMTAFIGWGVKERSEENDPDSMKFLDSIGAGKGGDSTSLSASDLEQQGFDMSSMHPGMEILIPDPETNQFNTYKWDAKNQKAVLVSKYYDSAGDESI